MYSGVNVRRAGAAWPNVTRYLPHEGGRFPSAGVPTLNERDSTEGEREPFAWTCNEKR